MDYKEYFDVVGHADANTIVVLVHGIFGNRRNVRSLARELVTVRPDIAVYCVDLRNHGRFITPDGPDTVIQCAKDIEMLLLSQGIHQVTAFVGHSFGGKVGLAALANWQDVSLAEVILLDSPPGVRGDVTSGTGDIAKVVKALLAHPGPFESREQALSQLVDVGLSSAIAQWLATNLSFENGQYRWRFSLARILAMLHDYASLDYWNLALKDERVQLIYGAKSRHWNASDRERMAAMRTRLHKLENAGHWVHADNLNGLVVLLAKIVEKCNDL